MSELTGKIWHLMDSRREPGEHFVPRSKPLILKDFFQVAERVGFEPTCRNYPTIRFRVGAVVTTSVPLPAAMARTDFLFLKTITCAPEGPLDIIRPGSVAPWACAGSAAGILAQPEGLK